MVRRSNSTQIFAIRFDAVAVLILALVSLELNVPYALDQLDFHNALPAVGRLGNLLVPGGLPHSLVILGKAFTPLKLVIRTFTVALLMVYLFLNLFRRSRGWRTGIVILLVALHVVIPQVLMIQTRVAQTNPDLAHDGGTLQMEAAMRMLLQGENPYTLDYTGTPVENWRGFGNNVIYHVPYMPGAFVFSIPVYLGWHRVFHWYDQRVFHLLLFIAGLAAIAGTVRDDASRAVATAMFGLNPFFARFFILGANDVVPMTLLLIAVWCARKQANTAAWFALCAACCVKQFAWFFAPFMLLHLLQVPMSRIALVWRRCREEWRTLLPGTILVAGMLLPFLFWDPKAFVDDTFRYAGGGLSTSYPIQGFHGYGAATLLLFLRIIPDGNAAFPFLVLQIPALVLAVFLLMCRIRGPLNLSVTTAVPALLLLVFLFFSRYLHGNFLGFTVFWLVYAFILQPDGHAHAVDQEVPV